MIKLQKKLTLLNLNLTPSLFITFKIITSIILFLILLFISKAGFIIAPLVTIIYFFLVEYIFIDLEINKRGLKLERDALEFFPIFLLSLKGGTNLKKAILLSTNTVNNSLSNEFKKVLDDLKVGKSLDESLSLLTKRIPSQIINNIILSIREANRYGNDISNSIKGQLTLIEEKYQKVLLKKQKYIPFILTILSIAFVFLMISILIIYSIIK